MNWKVYQIFQNFTRTERYWFLGTLAVFVISSILGITSYFYRHTVPIPVTSSKYTEGIIGQPAFINPVLAGANNVDRDLSEIIFSDLVDLTDRYTMSEDGKTWNIVLKTDLLWDDGKLLTSDDVIFTIETIQNADSRSPLFLTWQGIVAERISELEIRFTLRTPYAFFLDNLRDLKIIPKHIFGVIPAANLRLSDYNFEPIGNGPYKFISYQKRKDGFIAEYNFETNPNYALEKPFIKELAIKFYPDVTALIKAFNSKKIDGFGDLNPKNISDLKLNYQMLEIQIPRYYAIFYNQNSSESLKDKAVRMSLGLAIDKNKIIEGVFNNKAMVVNHPILPTMSDIQLETEMKNEFDLEKANKLLDQNKWSPNKEDGVREKKIGKNMVKLEFNVVVPQIPFLEETINLIKEDWQKIGVKLNPLILNPADITNEVIKTRNYQMIIFGNILRPNPDILSFWHSSERFYPGLNLALYQNKEVDSLLESIRKNFDGDSQKKDLEKLRDLITNDCPAAFLFSPIYLYIGPPGLGGFQEKVIATPSDRFENINKWYLKTARVFK